MFKIYGTNECSYCVLAKQLLNNNNINYNFINVSNNKTEILNKYSKISNNQRTIPLIFDNNEFIGGFQQLKEYISF